jgi:hypothetical protein
MELKLNSELLLKVFLTIIVLYFSIGSLRWIWRSQIDIKETVRKILETPQKSMDWIATREPDKIYQDGKVVGDVSGPVEDTDLYIKFQELSETSALNQNIPFEYQKYKLKIKQIESITGMKIDTSNDKSSVKRSVLSNVVCEKIKN